MVRIHSGVPLKSFRFCSIQHFAPCTFKISSCRIKTVSKLDLLVVLPYQNASMRPASLALRLIRVRASRFIWSFICEYFLKTLASVCRSICVTHSSATPPALSRVAYVDRRS